MANILLEPRFSYSFFVESNSAGLNGDFENWHEQFNQARLIGLKRDQRKATTHESCSNIIDGAFSSKKDRNVEGSTEVYCVLICCSLGTVDNSTEVSCHPDIQT
jgi:hypothetical protein